MNDSTVSIFGSGFPFRSDDRGRFSGEVEGCKDGDRVEWSRREGIDVLRWDRFEELEFFCLTAKRQLQYLYELTRRMSNLVVHYLGRGGLSESVQRSIRLAAAFPRDLVFSAEFGRFPSHRSSTALRAL